MKPIFMMMAVASTAMWSFAAQAQDFSFTFDWSDLELCTSGSPNVVGSPAFKVTGLPKGATGINFKLTDMNVPDFNHGGGWVAMSKDGTVPAGAFQYFSPCPPDGSHTYEWTADARAAKDGKTLVRAKASRKYP